MNISLLSSPDKEISEITVGDTPIFSKNGKYIKLSGDITHFERIYKAINEWLQNPSKELDIPFLKRCKSIINSMR